VLFSPRKPPPGPTDCSTSSSHSSGPVLTPRIAWRQRPKAVDAPSNAPKFFQIVERLSFQLEEIYSELLNGKGAQLPERILEKAVERMMPRGPLGRRQMTNLKVYKGAEHPHAAQNPEIIDFAARNSKNKRG